LRAILLLLDIYEEYKVQVLISHTPEGTNTVRVRLTAGDRRTISKAHAVSGEATELCTTPVVSGGIRVPEGPTNVSWVLELSTSRYKPSGTS